jgi:translation initiation factor IF-2
MATRVYELSKELGISSKDLLKLLQNQGFELASHIAIVPPEAIAKVKQIAAQSQQKQKLEEPKAVKATEVAPARPKEQTKEKEPENVLVLAPMSVVEIAQKAHKQVSEVILSLLKQGIVTTKNQLLPEKTVAQLAHVYGLKIVEKSKTPQAEEIKAGLETTAEGTWQERLPVVVVIGHVDHGKTTLLDFVRKTRVAAKEKGGITQHLGAYEVSTSQGGIVFLDTPGHEAFSLMRARGIRVADIAILIVAADDGVMPQTLDAIKLTKAAQVPIIVAINKIDKAAPAQIETVRRQLAQFDLVPEEWGGQTVCMPISAKTGEGVNELLEVIVLQAQLMELKANLTVPARGFILESKIEKGRGPVATVICQHGTLKVGQYFIAGITQGKVSSLMDTAGLRVIEVGPSTPVQVAGFSELPNAGDTFEVVLQEIFKKRAHGYPLEARPEATLKQTLNEDTIRLILKADNASSREALVGAIEKLSLKAPKKFSIVHTGVGDISESDVLLATDTQSLIYGFHVKTQPNALALIKKEQVAIKYYDIIYKLLEDLEALAQASKPIKTVLKKIGEAAIIKVFDIKGLGKVAGALVRSGRFVRDGKVVIWRGKQKVGEGTIKGLQRERKTVKEVHTGFEFALLVDGFDAWELEDRVECYQELPA